MYYFYSVSNSNLHSRATYQHPDSSHQHSKGGKWYEGLKKSFVSSNAPSAQSVGEIYTYKDKNGVTVILDKPIPEEYKNKANKITTYKLNSPEELRKYQEEQAAAEGRDSQRVRTAEKQTGDVDVTCKYECGVHLNICELDCKQLEACKDNCWKTHKNCMDKCDN